MNLPEDEKREVSVVLKQFVDFFYDREIALYHKFAGKHPDPDIDLALNFAMRTAFLSFCISRMSPLLKRFGITNEEFAGYIKEYHDGIHKRDKWYYDQEFSELDLPES